MNVAFYSKGPIDQISGGYIYNRNVIDYLRRQGVDVDYHADPAAMAKAKADTIIIVDSLIVADNLDRIARLPRPPILLMHVAMAGLAQQLLQARIIATSSETRRLLARCNVTNDSVVIEPGVPADWPRKPSYAASARSLLCVANYVAGKGHFFLLDTLRQLADTPWTLRMIGNATLDPACFETVRRQVQAMDLQDRVSVGNSVPHESVAQLMCESDLLLQWSEHESYSMVTAEAIACGLPVMATRTGNWPAFKASGLLTFLNEREPAHAASELQKLMTDDASYARLRPGASGTWRSWDDVGADFLNLLRCVA